LGVIKFIGSALVMLLVLAWDVLLHLLMTSIFCFALSVALKYSFSYEIIWYKLVVLWYAVYLVVNHFKNNLTSTV
jgi:hypothetical protein